MGTISILSGNRRSLLRSPEPDWNYSVCFDMHWLWFEKNIDPPRAAINYNLGFFLRVLWQRLPTFHEGFEGLRRRFVSIIKCDLYWNFWNSLGAFSVEIFTNKNQYFFIKLRLWKIHVYYLDTWLEVPMFKDTTIQSLFYKDQIEYLEAQKTFIPPCKTYFFVRSKLCPY